MEQSVKLINITPDELIDAFRKVVDERIKAIESKIQPQSQPRFYTRYDIAKLFSISLPTVHNWTNQGILKSYQIGGRVYYKSNEVESALKEINI